MAESDPGEGKSAIGAIAPLQLYILPPSETVLSEQKPELSVF